MIITKKALPRRTFLRGMGASLALPLLDAMVPSMTALAKTPADPGASPGVCIHADGMRHRAVDAAGRGPADRAVAGAPSLAPVMDQLTVLTNLELKNAYPGHPRHLQRRVPERGQGEVDRKHRLLPGHDGRPDRREADRPGNAAAVAGAGDGPAPDGRPVRQRLCVRLPEQSLVVVADDAASG